MDRKYIGTGGYWVSTEVHFAIRFPVSMRTAPALDAASGTNYYRNVVNTDDFNSFTIWRPTTEACSIYNGSEASGTAGSLAIASTINANAYVAFSAEL